MDFTAELSKVYDKNVEFVIAGFYEKESVDYYEKLRKKAETLPFRTHFAFEIVRNKRVIEDKKYYSLWDMYANADLVTYTSVAEGWGNQLIETVFAKKPLVVYEYPVYKSDIAPLGFKFFSLGDKAKLGDDGFYKVDDEILKRCVLESLKALEDLEYQNSIVEHNFEIGRKYLSLDSLEKYIRDILRSVS